MKPHKFYKSRFFLIGLIVFSLVLYDRTFPFKALTLAADSGRIAS